MGERQSQYKGVMRREARVWVEKTQRDRKNVAREDGSKEDGGRKGPTEFSL
jgi:hypothetical protein